MTTNCGGVNIVCNDDERRSVLQANAPPNNGIAAVEVYYVPTPPNPATVCFLRVYFFGGNPAGLDNTQRAKFALTGGVRVPGSAIHIVHVTPTAGPDPYVQLELDRYGDHSQYILTIDWPGLDRLYNCREFSFTVDCPDPFDCKPPPPLPQPLPADPAIDYLSKDYASFRQALLSFLPTRVPAFSETNEADLAITLAELFAYAGDQLSYYQDAVLNEAYLSTARQRVSAKRLARLVDYRMHDGSAARAIVQFTVTGPTALPRSAQVLTDDPIQRRVVFEMDEGAQLVQEQNPATAGKLPADAGITPYTWLDTQCCLPAGSTQADLAGKLTTLVPGQLLLFEEFLSPHAEPGGTLIGLPADTTRRQVVRLTSIDNTLTDPLNANAPVTRIQWGTADALLYSFCLECDTNGNPATLVSGNLVRASNGVTITGEQIDPSQNPVPLLKGPLTWLSPPASTGKLSWLVPPDIVNPRSARSSIELTINGEAWNEQETLLDSTADSPDFTVDVDDNFVGMLRFGDGALGRVVSANDVAVITYRIGNGSLGNVQRDALTVAGTGTPGSVSAIRNPLPAVGGIDPEPITDVQRDAPLDFQSVQYRAVTAADYAQATCLVPGAANAVAIFRWTGSWLTVFVSVEPLRAQVLSDSLKAAVVAQLDSYRQAGYDLEIRPPLYVAVQIELAVCVDTNYFQGDVLAAVLAALAVLFKPNQFTFGQSVYLSAVYAAVQNVSGVRAVRAITFKRMHEQDNGDLASGEIPMGMFGIARLDNDPDFPDNGTLTVDLDGGK
jgi:Baseplate J-like protein